MAKTKKKAPSERMTKPTRYTLSLYCTNPECKARYVREVELRHEPKKHEAIVVVCDKCPTALSVSRILSSTKKRR